MMESLRRECKSIILFWKNNKREIGVVALATLLITLHEYHDIRNEWVSYSIYYVVIPVVIILLLRESPFDWGLGWGNPKIWGPYVGISCVIFAPLLYFFSRTTEFQNYYKIEQFGLATYILTNCVSLFGAEFIYRGFLLFGLKDKLKEASIIVQMIPFVLVHFGKPEAETLSTIFTGIYFGWIAYRGKSFWPAYFIHLFINLFFVALINRR